MWLVDHRKLPTEFRLKTKKKDLHRYFEVENSLKTKKKKKIFISIW